MAPKPKRPKKLAGLKKAPLKPGSPAASLGSLTGRISSAGRKATLWPALDSTELGFRAGELCLVAGRSAHGKSNFLLNLLLNWLEQPGEQRFFYYSLEMTPAQAAARLLSMIAAKRHSISMSSSRALGFLKGETAPPQVARAIAELKGLEERLSFVYEPMWDVERLAADAGMKARGDGPGAVFVDSVTSLLAPPERSRNDRRDLELAHISRRLKELSVRLNCPMIGAAPTKPLAQVEGEGLRALIGKGREFHDPEVEDLIRARRPRLSHLGEATLEQESDMVLGLLSYLSDFHSEMEPDHRALFTSRTKGLLEVSALKNRLGSLDAAELVMDSKTSLIRDDPAYKSL